MVRNNFMMHLCTFATLCFFKITFPRNYYYCNQDDTIPWVCVLKYVSNSNCCHRHLKLYISMFKSFHTYRKYIYQQSYFQSKGNRKIIMIKMIVKICQHACVAANCAHTVDCDCQVSAAAVALQIIIHHHNLNIFLLA